MSTGVFSDRYKTAYITLLIQMSGLVTTDARSYQLRINLYQIVCCIKLLERLVPKQVIDYLQSNNLLLDQQSAYRPSFSTETATLRVMS